jgi:hypothetical protein
MSNFTGRAALVPGAPYGSGKLYAFDGVYQIGAGNNGVAATVRMWGASIRRSVKIASLISRLTAAAAGGLFQVAIYRSDALTGDPTGPPIYTSASQSTAGAGIVAVAGVNKTLDPGFYWFATQVDATGAPATFVGSISVEPGAMQQGGVRTTANFLTNLGSFQGWSIAAPGGYGNWPTLTGNSNTDGLAEVFNQSIPIWGMLTA